MGKDIECRLVIDRSVHEETATTVKEDSGYMEHLIAWNNKPNCSVKQFVENACRNSRILYCSVKEMFA